LLSGGTSTAGPWDDGNQAIVAMNNEIPGVDYLEILNVHYNMMYHTKCAICMSHNMQNIQNNMQNNVYRNVKNMHNMHSIA
jgi:hypothetical protein